MATVLGEEQYRCPWALLAEEDEECVTTLLEMFFDWDTLGLLPFGAARMGDLPAWLVDSFRVCAEVDKIATMKQKMQTQAAMMGASAAGRLA
ncbi:MAG: hypothetical protein JKY94_16770 [Rhodobacteraceae bacterium]|nr:hypothetical protein [Paracoccaceae bacterium]